MAEANDTTDVGTLLATLRSDVRARRLSQPAAADDPLQRDLQRALDEIELARVVSAHWPLIGHTLPTRAIALLNKLVRRYLRWYINPIVEQQNAYNDAVARTLRLLADAYADLVHTPQAEPPPMPPINGGTDNAGIDLRVIQQARASTEPPARFPDLELQAQLPPLMLRQQVSAHWPLPAHTLSERGVALLNKLVRRYLRWYVNPIVEQQNTANLAISAALLAFVRLDAERRASAAAQRARRNVR